MAAPVYEVDLIDLTLCESTAGFSALGGGGAGLGAGLDFAIQGTNAVDKQVTANSGTVQKGMIYDNGSTITMGADDHVFIWIFAATPGLLEPITNDGKTVTIGTATNAINNYSVDGADTQAEGGNRAYAVRYGTATPSPGSQVGTPGANPQWFGGQLNVNGVSKGVNLGLDAIRYGSGGFISQGDSGDTASFGGFATENDSNSNKWGILAEAPGGYEMQGKFYIGRTSGGTITDTYFIDSNALIVLTDTIHSLSDFTQFIIESSGTTCNWTNINILALGTGNTGQVNVYDSSASVNFNTCTFDSIGVINFAAGTTASNCTFRNTEQINQSGSTISNSTITGNKNTSAILGDDLDNISNNSFEHSDGHAIEITVGGVYTFAGNSFDGGYTGGTDAAIYNNSGTGVTLNITSGGDTPTIRNGSGATTTVNNNTSITLTGMTNNTEVRVYSGGSETELAGIENAINGSSDDRSFTFSLAAGLNVDIRIFNIQYIPADILGFTIPTTDTNLPISQVFDRNYNNP